MPEDRPDYETDNDEDEIRKKQLLRLLRLMRDARTSAMLLMEYIEEIDERIGTGTFQAAYEDANEHILLLLDELDEIQGFPPIARERAMGTPKLDED